MMPVHKAKLMSNGKYCLMDHDTYHKLKKYKVWCTTKGFWYPQSQLGPVHRLAIDAKEDEVIDHINRDRLNATRANLRVTTMRGNSTFRLGKGYTRLKSGRYRAQMCVNHQRVCLGTFDTSEEAAEVYMHYKNQQIRKYVK
jgi:hypothetical protein